MIIDCAFHSLALSLFASLSLSLSLFLYLSLSLTFRAELIGVGVYRREMTYMEGIVVKLQKLRNLERKSRKEEERRKELRKLMYKTTFL